MLLQLLSIICAFSIVLGSTLLSFINTGFTYTSIFLVCMTVISFFTLLLFIIRYTVILIKGGYEY